MIRKLSLFCLAVTVLLSLSLNALAASIQYDLAFRHYGQLYFPWQDWRHWKAQGLAESKLDPKATSYCGAVGLMQLMPITAKGLGVNPYSPESNIQGGIKYDRQLWRSWTSIPDSNERRDFTYASYNAGLGWILKARKKAAGAKTWEPVSAALSAITGAQNAKQTQNYILHIRAFYRQLTGGR